MSSTTNIGYMPFGESRAEGRNEKKGLWYSACPGAGAWCELGDGSAGERRHYNKYCCFTG